MRASYELRWKRSAARELKMLPRDVARRVLGVVEQLPSAPHPPGTRKVVGAAHTFRLRVGDYRVVYTVLTDELIIEVIRVGHRKGVYRR